MGCVEAEFSWQAQPPELSFAGLTCAGLGLLLLQRQLFPPCLRSVIPSSTPVLGPAQLEHLLCWKAGLAEE